MLTLFPYTTLFRSMRLEKAVEERSAELAEANRVLEEMTLTDPLTSVRNRRYFQVTIPADVGQAVRSYAAGGISPAKRNRDLIFYLIDADHFKEINDRFGHGAGDQVLIEMTRRISSAIRKMCAADTGWRGSRRT